MKPKKRQKLCHNCEGGIDVDVIVCPFCAADLREERPEERSSSYLASMKESASKSQVSQSLYSSEPRKVQKEEVLEEEVAAVVATPEEAKAPSVFLPTILFTLGVQLFLFGLLVLLFSHKGVVVLKWDARFWFFYILMAFPFLIFGYRSLSKL